MILKYSGNRMNDVEINLNSVFEAEKSKKLC
jgi:hypothetical protein